MKQTRFSPGRVAVALPVAALLLHAASEQWTPECDETRTGQYTFEKLGGSSRRPVKIYFCPEASCAKKSEFATVTGNSYSAPRPAGESRPYFLVERRSDDGKTTARIIGARRLVLEGAYNFRDLGGLQTADGKTVRWGQIFRSDTLTHLTPADYQRLNAIGISLVCDLRTREERQSDPTEWQGGSPVFVLAPVSENDRGASQNNVLVDALQSNKMTVEEGKKFFEAFYVGMVFDSASKFGAVLRAIGTNNRPSMFHCTGGRDRTGITAALLLHMLGVPNETIVSDFLLSTQYLNERAAPLTTTPVKGQQASVYEEVIRLQPRYIEAVFKAIDGRFGSFDNYRREALHLSDVDVAALKSRLLE
ncbi:MAG: tyrosine-protein phosphatase [Acidobacteriia bacterium]|nr:tyrosine-protein phosphatase [Terriglobia bacterium]